MNLNDTSKPMVPEFSRIKRLPPYVFNITNELKMAARRAICQWYKRRWDVDLDMDREAIVTIGSKEGLAHLMLATLDRGDTVLVPDPSYPIHLYGAVIAGAEVR